jgi:hypothetical protein
MAAEVKAKERGGTVTEGKWIIDKKKYMYRH